MRGLCNKLYYIEQAYLLKSKSMTVRLRKQRDHKDKTKYILTLKKKVQPTRIIEIEKKISKSDFREMALEAEGWVTKIRYVIGCWDVDFFKKDRETYFSMAEIEMEDGVKEPEKLPKFVADNLLYMVKREDCRFSSKKLSNVEYAKSLLQEIERGAS